jgi:hypothetical protein
MFLRARLLTTGLSASRKLSSPRFAMSLGRVVGLSDKWKLAEYRRAVLVRLRRLCAIGTSFYRQFYITRLGLVNVNLYLHLCVAVLYIRSNARCETVTATSP